MILAIAWAILINNKEKKGRMKKTYTKNEIVKLVARLWANYDQWINTTCEHHRGRWSREKQLELSDAMSRRDAYQDILNQLGYFN